MELKPFTRQEFDQYMQDFAGYISIDYDTPTTCTIHCAIPSIIKTLQARGVMVYHHTYNSQRYTITKPKGDIAVNTPTTKGSIIYIASLNECYVVIAHTEDKKHLVVQNIDRPTWRTIHLDEVSEVLL